MMFSGGKALYSEPCSERALNVIVVDDDPFFGNVVRKMLERCGFICLSVTSIAALSEVMEDGYEPDLVVTDLHISQESGCDVLQYFRSHGRFRDTPVLLISSDEAGPRVAADHHFDGFLSKTCLYAKLVSSVDGLLS